MLSSTNASIIGWYQNQADHGALQSDWDAGRLSPLAPELWINQTQKPARYLCALPYCAFDLLLCSIYRLIRSITVIHSMSWWAAVLSDRRTIMLHKRALMLLSITLGGASGLVRGDCGQKLVFIIGQVWHGNLIREINWREGWRCVRGSCIPMRLLRPSKPLSYLNSTSSPPSHLNWGLFSGLNLRYYHFLFLNAEKCYILWIGRSQNIKNTQISNSDQPLQLQQMVQLKYFPKSELSHLRICGRQSGPVIDSAGKGQKKECALLELGNLVLGTTLARKGQVRSSHWHNNSW